LHHAPIPGPSEEALLDDAVPLLVAKGTWIMNLFECSPFFHRRCIANKRNPARGRQESEQWGWEEDSMRGMLLGQKDIHPDQEQSAGAVFVQMMTDQKEVETVVRIP
jgi:hypothetical protein